MTRKGKRNVPWTDERRAAVVAAYTTGRTMMQMAKEFRTSTNYIAAALDAAGISHGRKDPPDFDISGRRFGRLLVVARETKRGAPGETFWLCRCNCGSIFRMTRARLVNGSYKSCGCGQGIVKHGMSRGKGHETYQAWSDMKTRCLNPRNKFYPQYGARGITVCNRWLKFENFYLDMGERPPGKVLGRRDTNGNYDQSNCLWTTLEEMRNSQSKVKKITFKGITQSVPQWARTYGVKEATFAGRLKRGWSVERAGTQPIDTRRHRKKPR